MEPNPQLVTYLQQAFAAGHSEETIRGLVTKQGWSDFDVGLAWQAAKIGVGVKPKKTGSSMNASEIMLFIGGVIVIVAAVTLIASGWDDLGAGGRILTALVPNLILVSAGALLWRNLQVRHAAYAFLVTGGVIMPATLGIIVWQLTEQSTAEDPSRFLTTAILSMVAYTIILLKYRTLIWSTLLTIAAIAAYSFLLLTLHIEDWAVANPYLWAYVLLGVILFAIGLLVEQAGWRFHSRASYSFGSLSFLIAAVTLGLTGSLFGGATNYASGFQNEQRFETLGIGILILAIGWGFQALRRRGFEEASHVRALWDLVGTAMTCGAFLLVDRGVSLGSGLLAILLCLGFVYLAVKVQNRQYFQAGTLLLVVSLIKMGSDNFSGTLAWPIMLMLSGLVFMGAGFLLVRGQKEWFPKNTLTAESPK